MSGLGLSKQFGKLSEDLVGVDPLVMEKASEELAPGDALGSLDAQSVGS